MSGLLRGAFFLGGAYLGMRTLAALYRALDLAYALRREYPRVLRGIVGWGGPSAVVVAFADAPERRAFLCGFLAFLLFYLSLFGLRHLVLRPLRPLELTRPRAPVPPASPGRR